jgi:phosphate transport system substrate-binding protein
MVKHRRFAGMFVALLALMLVAAACSSDDGSSDGSASATDGEELTGSITISGSSTVEPISSIVAEVFNETNTQVAIDVSGPGTGDGFELFCNGETDISDASRPIDEDEVKACKKNGIEYVELRSVSMA